MGKTITEKILTRACGKETTPGDLIWADVDVVFTHETVGPRVFGKSLEVLGDRICVPERFAVFVDHYNLPSTKAQAEIVKYTRDWSRAHRVEHFYLFCGPEHQILAEEGFYRPGAVVVGTDSHTVTGGALGAFATGIGSTDCALVLATGKIWLRVPDSVRFQWDGDLPEGVMAKDMILHMIGAVGHGGATYQACEFMGTTVEGLTIDERMTLCNMTVEMGAKNGIINADEKTLDFVHAEIRLPINPMRSDPDAEYRKEYHYEASELEPLVASPHNVDNVVSVKEVEGTRIDSVLIGTCTGGKFDDMIAALRILDGRRIHREIYTIIMPASWRVYRRMLREGMLEKFLEAGCTVTHPTCGPCAGHLTGLTAPNEVRISAQNRNFQGRSGSESAEIYLASPMTCAASAIEGRIADPRQYL